jgi:hypothetical protein
MATRTLRISKKSLTLREFNLNNHPLIMKKLSLILIAMLLTGSMTAQISYLQYRHVPSEHESKFLERETKHWSKVAESAIKKGQMNSWSLWRVIGTMGNDASVPNYVFVNTYDNLEQMDPQKVWGDNMDAIGDVKPEDIETDSFTSVTYDYYVQSEDQIPGDFKYALVNYAKPTDLAAFIQENKELWKPLHQASIDNIMNNMTYWGMSSVIYPAGNQALFSVYTVDGFEKLNDALDYLRFTETATNSMNAAGWNDVIDKTQMDELTPNGFERRVIYERVMGIDE